VTDRLGEDRRLGPRPATRLVAPVRPWYTRPTSGAVGGKSARSTVDPPMPASSHVPLPLPLPLALIASALLLAAALILLGLAALTWRYAARLAPFRARRVVTAWRVVGMSFALWGLGLLVFVGLSLAYPFDGRQLLLPPVRVWPWRWRSPPTPWCRPASR
jgi:hypothetical protein